jgi:hypothetical protein
VKGFFHIAPGRNAKGPGGAHMHDSFQKIPFFNLSHVISRARFGPRIPGSRQPLEGKSWIMPMRNPSRSQYMIMATPVIYMKDGKVVERGYEYTSYISHRVITGMMMMVPGIFFAYQFAPYTVTIHVMTMSLSQFVTSICGVLAGLYGMVAFLDEYLQTKEIVVKKPAALESENK